jgi:anti-anti-sigma regulatory factor
MSNPSAKLSVLVGRDFACVKIAGRANFMSSPDFKTLLGELNQKGYNRFIVDLSECVLMDSTFLGVLAGFGLKTNAGGAPGKYDIELANPNARVSELLDNLGVLPLFKITTGAVQLPGNAEPCAPELANPTQMEITRTSLEAHQSLMAAHPDNVARFKDVAQFLAEDLKNLEKSS